MDVLFAVMPFKDAEHPSIGVSLLQAELARAGFSSEVLYLNLDLAERIGTRVYGWLAQCGGTHFLEAIAPPAVNLVGEWFFADHVFPGRLPPEADYLARFVDPDPVARRFKKALLRARKRRGAFIEHCVREILRRRARVVGFTTTFHQTCACLAVAQRLKAQPNPPVIIFGGANCEAEMGCELLKSFPWVDYVCTGEGDLVVPEFFDRLLRRGDPRGMKGILRQGESPELSVPDRVQNLDALPIPDFSDYFRQLRAKKIRAQIEPRLLLETARGCWWGDKHHCTFCGLNGESMAFRSKSPRRVLDEIDALLAAWRIRRIECVDNILDVRYIDSLFPEIIRRRTKVQLFYETKANLRFDQLRTLRDAGVRILQPGIESFSNQALRLMRKGCTGLQNIQFLRWCEELGIEVLWNLIFGFPGESPEEYERMARLVPQLAHLQPPEFCLPIRMDRFSPIFTESDAMGLTEKRPVDSYSYVYPLERESLEQLAYFFDFSYADGRDPRRYTRKLVGEVRRWAKGAADARPALDFYSAGDAALILDTRDCAVRSVHVLAGPAARIYSLCDTIQTPSSLERELAGAASAREIQSLLKGFLANRLLVEMEGRCLSLAVVRNRKADPARVSDNLAARREPTASSALVTLS